MHRTHLGLFTLAAALAAPLAPAATAGDHAHNHEAAHDHERQRPVPDFNDGHHPFLANRLPEPQTHEKAGYPQCVSPLSMPSFTSHYRGGYVGGGVAHGGDLPCPHEGTWGWDYTGLRPRGSRIFNGWSHGRRAQGGFGSYATDGPRPLEALKERAHGGHD